MNIECCLHVEKREYAAKISEAFTSRRQLIRASDVSFKQLTYSPSWKARVA